MINNSINSSFIDVESTSINTFPVKLGINFFENSALNSCVGYGGLVSNLNCPKEVPFCNCDPKTFEISPVEKEPTDRELDKALYETKECNRIWEVFKSKNKYLKFYGFDYSEPNSAYNCSVEQLFSDFYSEYGDKYYFGSTDGFTFDPEFSILYDNAGYFPYARRKSYTEGNTANAFPTFTQPPTTPPIRKSDWVSSQKLIGEYFKYYLEYSKTNATFWNTPPQTPLLRRAQINLLLYQRIKILVNGSFKIKPGNMINIAYPTAESPVISQSRFAGRWMVYKVKRIINAQKHSMYLFLMRDGLNGDPDVDYEDIQFKKEA